MNAIQLIGAIGTVDQLARRSREPRDEAEVSEETRERRRIERRRASNVKAANDMYRSRLDFRWNESGQLVGYLTLTLAGGHAVRFSAEFDAQTAYERLQKIIAERAEKAGIQGEIGFFNLKKVWNGVKKVGKAIVTSKVFKMAATGLLAAVPVIGPIAATTAAALQATNALGAAKNLLAKGNKAGAAKLVSHAAALSKAAPAGAPPIAPSTPANPNPMLDVAHKQSGAVYRLMLQKV